MNIFDSKAVFERILNEMESQLSAKGFTKTQEEYNPEITGNRYVVFSGRSGLVRFIWDEKDERLILRNYKQKNWLHNVISMTLLGRNDPYMLTHECIMNRDELIQLDSEQITERYTSAWQRSF
jgi:hypothetical protein